MSLRTAAAVTAVGAADLEFVEPPTLSRTTINLGAVKSAYPAPPPTPWTSAPKWAGAAWKSSETARQRTRSPSIPRSAE
jgi:hypothetical protein